MPADGPSPVVDVRSSLTTKVDDPYPVPSDWLSNWISSVGTSWMRATPDEDLIGLDLRILASFIGLRVVSDHLEPRGVVEAVHPGLRSRLVFRDMADIMRLACRDVSISCEKKMMINRPKSFHEMTCTTSMLFRFATSCSQRVLNWWSFPW
jgi:hypothetical protein